MGRVVEFRRSSPWLWPVVVLLVVFVLAVILVSLSLSSGTGYVGMMGGATGWWVVVMMLPLGVLVLVLLLAGISGTHKVPLMSPPGAPGYLAPPSALEILDARYARGEISRDEYLRVRSDLTEPRRGSP